MTFPGLEITILKFHDLSRFSMTVRTLRGTHQVRHDDGIHEDGLGGGPQGELEASRRLPRADVETMAFQQKVLQLVLCGHDVLHLRTHGRARAVSLDTSPAV